MHSGILNVYGVGVKEDDHHAVCVIIMFALKRQSGVFSDGFWTLKEAICRCEAITYLSLTVDLRIGLQQILCIRSG